MYLCIKHKIQLNMTQDELLSNLYTYVCDNVLTFEERRSMGIKPFYKWVEDNFEPIPKSELEIGKEYQGNCRNSHKAVWDGNVFWYTRYKFGSTYDESINHYEDDDGYDVFVPIREKMKNI